jgi:Ni,Fe-hydrogenase maturation factor
MKRILFIGYGNLNRGDDGAAFHLLIALLNDFGKVDVDLFSSDPISLDASTDIFYNFQLLPEFAELISQYQKVIFIDSHIKGIEENIKFLSIEPEYQFSPFTHHFTPSACLAVTESLTGRHPEAWLLSIRGFDFGFKNELSKRTHEFVFQALDIIRDKFIN